MKIQNITVDYIDHLGTDLTVVNAARVSFNKHHNELDKSDPGLIKYLAKNNHFSPFTHCQIQLRVTAPIFIARQAFKSKIGLAENEQSRRYVSEEPGVYFPETWRKSAANKKQGSSDEVIEQVIVKLGNECATFTPDELVTTTYEIALKTYDALIDGGVCPELARMVLPQGMMTSWYWTGSLFAFARVYKLRSSHDAQKEIQFLAQQINNIVKNLYPLSWAALTKEEEEK